MNFRSNVLYTIFLLFYENEMRILSNYFFVVKYDLQQI